MERVSLVRGHELNGVVKKCELGWRGGSSLSKRNRTDIVQLSTILGQINIEESYASEKVI